MPEYVSVRTVNHVALHMDNYQHVLVTLVKCHPVSGCVMVIKCYTTILNSLIINSSALISYSEQHVTCYVGFKARLQTLQYLVKPVSFYSVLNQSLNTQTQKHQMTVLHWVPSDVWPQYLDLSGLASAASKLFIFHLSAPSSPSWSQVPS